MKLCISETSESSRDRIVEQRYGRSRDRDMVGTKGGDRKINNPRGSAKERATESGRVVAVEREE